MIYKVAIDDYSKISDKGAFASKSSVRLGDPAMFTEGLEPLRMDFDKGVIVGDPFYYVYDDSKLNDTDIIELDKIATIEVKGK